MAYNWKKQASAAYGCSLARLALQVFMYMEDFPSSYEGAWSKRQGMDEQFMKLLAEYRREEAPADDALMEETEAFRNLLTGRTETVIAYTDCFQIYEYAWNRLERRFLTDLKPTGISDGEMTQELMRYLTIDQDAAVTNQRIQQVIGELPVRFTRRKYYGMVREALTSYIGADMEGLNTMMYLLRTGSMTDLTREQKESEPELGGLLEALQAISMRDASADDYREAKAKLKIAADRLSAMSEYLHMMQDMVNDLCILLLTRKDAMRDAALEEHAGRILDGLHRMYEEHAVSIPDEIGEELPYLEGAQERYFEAYTRLDPVPASGRRKDGKMSGEFKVERLMSSSTYVSIQEEPEEGTVTAEAVDAAADAFIAGVEPVFAACQKPVMRAIMAGTLSTLPVCFNSLNEVREYIEGSFASCADPAEKETCKELLLQLMEMDAYDAMV